MKPFLLFIVLAALTPLQKVEKAQSLYEEDRCQEAVGLLSEAIPNLRSAGGKDELGDALSTLASAYYRLGAYNLALKTQRECFALDKERGDTADISSSLNNLAAICITLEDYDQAEAFILESIRYEEMLDRPACLAIRYGMACEVFEKSGKQDLALEYGQKALRLDEEGARTLAAARRKSQLATVYIRENRFDDAWRMLREALPVFEAEGNRNSLCIAHRQAGQLMQIMGHFDAAASHYQQALSISRDTGNRGLEKKISCELADLLSVRKPAQALVHLQHAMDLSDTLYRKESARQLSELRLEYDMAAKDREIVAQRQELRARRTASWLLSLLVLLLAVALLLLVRINRVRARNNRMLRDASRLKDRLLALGAPADKQSEMNSILDTLAKLGEQPEAMLSAREREVADLCCEGLSTKEIAERLFLSPRTVDNHKNNIFRKLGINSTVELVSLMHARR